MGAKLSVQKNEVPAERTFIVTGANTGIGYQTSKKIAQLGGRVVMACRSEEKAKKAIERMQEENKQEVRAKRKAEKDAVEKERQQKEAAVVKEQQEKKKEEERNKKEEAKKAQAAKKEEEKSKEVEGKKKDGAEKAEEKGDQTEEEKPTEDGAKPAKDTEETPAEDGDKPAEDKPAETGDKPAEDKPAEDGDKTEEEKPTEDGEKQTKDATETPPAEDGDKPAEEKPAEDGDKPAENGDKPSEEEKEVAATADAPVEPEPEAEIPELKVQFMQLDLSSFKSTLDFVKQYKESGLPLHVLICNGGLIAPSKVMTDDGMESTLQINYLSHFLLTLHLLPLLKASAPNSKIINISSSGHKQGEGVKLDNIQSQKSYNQARAYGNSKLFQIMNMFTLHSKIKDSGIDVFTVHPGVVDTQFSKGYSGIFKAATIFHKGFGRNSNDGAATTLTAALDEQYNGKSPIYFSSCKPAQPNGTARNEEQQNILWRYSLELLREHLDDTLLAEIGETVESIQPKEPEPVVEDEKKEEETKKEDKVAEEDKPAAENKVEKEEDKPEEKKEEKTGDDAEAATPKETEEKPTDGEEKPKDEEVPKKEEEAKDENDEKPTQDATEEKPSEEQKEDGEAEKTE